MSAFFILTANAWMRHPVGYHIVGHGAGRKAELTNFWAVLRNSTLWAEFSHTVLAAFVTGAMLVLGASGWQLPRRNTNVAAFTRSARLSAAVALVCVVLVIVTGDIQARLMMVSVAGTAPATGSAMAPPTVSQTVQSTAEPQTVPQRRTAGIGRACHR